MNLNNQLFFQIQKLKGKIPGLNLVMVFGAEAVIYLAAILTFIPGFTKKGLYQQALILSFISIPLSLSLILLIHIFIKEKRPFIKFHFKPLVSFYRNLSFPSTHTTIMTILTFAEIYYKTDLGLLFLFMLLWLSISRIYIGVHYPIDILGGFITGIISLTFALAVKSF